MYWLRFPSQEQPRSGDEVGVERLLVETWAAVPLGPQLPCCGLRRAAQSLEFAGVQFEIPPGDLRVPGVVGMQRPVGQPVALGDHAGPGLEEAHVALGPAVLVQAGPRAHLHEVDQSNGQRDEDDRQQQGSAMADQPAPEPADRIVAQLERLPLLTPRSYRHAAGIVELPGETWSNTAP